MAQRTPIRSIFSVVPSTQASGETPKGEQPSERGASKERNSSEKPARRENRRDNRRQQRRQQTQQAQPQPRQPNTERPPSQRSEFTQAQQGNRNNGRQSVAPLPVGRRSNQPVPINPRQVPFGNLSDSASRQPLPGTVPFANPSGRLGKETKQSRPDSAPQRSEGSRGRGPGIPAERRSSRQPNAGGGSQPGNRSPGSGNAQLPLNPQKSSPSRQPRQKKANAPRKSISPLVYGARMLIVGVGIGVIAGTLLSIFDPASRFSTDSSKSNATETQQQIDRPQSVAALATAAPTLPFGAEIGPLTAQLQALAGQNSDLIPGGFFVDIDTGAYVDVNGSLSFAAASTIKVPILIAFFQDVDTGKIRLDERLTMAAEAIAEGSGEMQYKPPGTQYTAMETVTLMITISDNTATNMLIERLGGAEALNQRFQSWGLNETAIRNKLPDLEGTNTTSPKDLVNLMTMVNQGKLVSLRSRDRLLEIMRHTVNDSLLPQGLGSGATIAHKTGDIGSSIADVGLVDLPNGKRYIAAVIVKRPHNDARAEELIRQFSRTAYQHFSQPQAK